MFTLDQLRNLGQEIDDHFTKITKRTTDQDVNDSNEKIRAILHKLEDAFSETFSQDNSALNKNHFTFVCNNKIFAIYFYLNMLTINDCAHLINSEKKLSEIQFVFDQFTPVHEFIFNNCNPEGAFLLEKVLFREHL